MHLPAMKAPLMAQIAMVATLIGGSLAFTSPWFPLQTLIDVQLATGHWVSATLLGAGTIGGIGVLIGVFWGRQSLRDLGWRVADLLPGLFATLVLWAAMQVSTMISAQVTGTPLVLGAGWSMHALGGAMLGPLLAQLAANALMEETNFRAFLWPQIALRLRLRLRPPLALAVAALASQLVFAVMHVPIRLYGGADPATLGMMLVNLFAIGLVFCLLYAWTRNLFIVVGYHALLNTPTMIFDPVGPSPQLVATIGVLALAAGSAWRRRRPLPAQPFIAGSAMKTLATMP